MNTRDNSVAAISVARLYADSDPKIALDIIRSLPEVETMNLAEFLHCEDVLFLIDVIGDLNGDER